MKTIVPIIIILGAFFSSYLYIDRIYAKAQRLQLVELRLEQKITCDILSDKQERYWKLEDRCRIKCNEDEKKEMRELKEEVDLLKDKIKGLQNKQ